MFYAVLKTASPENFKRATGISDFVFFTLLQAYQTHHRRTVMGRPRRLSQQDELLLALMDGREYRTHFHIAQTYQVSEATARRIIRQVENAVIPEQTRRAFFQDPRLHLSGKKHLLLTARGGTDATVLKPPVCTVIVDVTECPVERPPKSNVGIIAERKSDIRRKHS